MASNTDKLKQELAELQQHITSLSKQRKSITRKLKKTQVLSEISKYSQDIQKFVPTQNGLYIIKCTALYSYLEYIGLFRVEIILDPFKITFIENSFEKFKGPG